MYLMYFVRKMSNVLSEATMGLLQNDVCENEKKFQMVTMLKPMVKFHLQPRKCMSNALRTN